MSDHSGAGNVHTRRIAEFVSTLSYERIPAEVIERIKLLILDSLGCAIYGAQLEWCRILRLDARKPGCDPHHVGLGHAASPLLAARRAGQRHRRCRASSSTTFIARACCTWARSRCPR